MKRWLSVAIAGLVCVVCLSGCVGPFQNDSARIDAAVAETDLASAGDVVCDEAGGPEPFDFWTTERWWRRVEIEGSDTKAKVVEQLIAAGFEERGDIDDQYIDRNREVGATVYVVAADDTESLEHFCPELPDSGKVIVSFGT